MAAFATYADLKTRLAQLLDRDDISTDHAEALIELFETQANSQLRVAYMECHTTARLDDSHLSLKDDFLGARSVAIQGSPKRVLAQVGYEDLLRLQETDTASGKPTHYALSGGNLWFHPAPDAAYTVEIVYYKKIPALSDSNTTNWLLERFPSAYLYGAAAQSGPLLREDERVPMWTEIYAAVMKSIVDDDAKRRFGGRLSLPIRAIG